MTVVKEHRQKKRFSIESRLYFHISTAHGVYLMSSGSWNYSSGFFTILVATVYQYSYMETGLSLLVSSATLSVVAFILFFYIHSMCKQLSKHQVRNMFLALILGFLSAAILSFSAKELFSHINHTMPFASFVRFLLPFT
jgi:hypothetical protein